MPTDSPARPGLTVSAWKVIAKGALLGVATVRLPNGLTIFEVPVLRSGGRTWANLPGKPQIGADGTALRGDNGKPRYTPFAAWPDRATGDGFSAAVVAAVEAAHPGALS
jgi:hypothetical protein